MKTRFPIAGLLTTFSLFSQAVNNPPTGFKPAQPCVVPWDKEKKTGKSVDDASTGCNVEGTKHSYATGPAAKLSPAQIAQNRAKNNFCNVSNATPKPVDFQTLTELQQAVADTANLDPSKQILFGEEQLIDKSLPDRSKLMNLETATKGTYSEGDKVRIVAFIYKAKFSDTYNPKLRGVMPVKQPKKAGEGGESVNCYLPGNPENDVHIALVDAPTNHDECSSVTSEMTPHFRPDSWSSIPLIRDNKSTPPAELTQWKVRVTGQLFFDAAHRPCENGAGLPARASLWEIHPVYAFEICKDKTAKQCDIDKDDDWQGVGDWQKAHPHH